MIEAQASVMGAPLERTSLRFLNGAGRLYGGLCLIVGLTFVAVSIFDPADRVVHLGGRAFLLVFGAAFLVAKTSSGCTDSVLGRTRPTSGARTSGSPERCQPRTRRTRGRRPPVTGCAGGRATTYLYPVREEALAPRGPMRTSFGT